MGKEDSSTIGPIVLVPGVLPDCGGSWALRLCGSAQAPVTVKPLEPHHWGSPSRLAPMHAGTQSLHGLHVHISKDSPPVCPLGVTGQGWQADAPGPSDSHSCSETGPGNDCSPHLPPATAPGQSGAHRVGEEQGDTWSGTGGCPRHTHPPSGFPKAQAV
ncbi:rho guanine nucleotide exchange factor 5-like [Platysternon megacephalum]|uniref:Rho guanine nucleotide exchange factor 5-like n=1 Tax=Platysternon megacephalum TaxID=55544 RepID=A0A4D9DQP8_9SAUR|nr:rho guanine nucleotide exchange factor 5-like [Platysternon megacephalum]